MRGGWSLSHPRHPPASPHHLGSVITHSGREHPISPLMDVSREVAGTREEQDVGGEDLVTVSSPPSPPRSIGKPRWPPSSISQAPEEHVTE